MLAIVCALPCEAQPLISYFRLKLIRTRDPFSFYANSSLYLIVTGIGPIQTAAAMGYLQGKIGNLSHMAWLNVGIAGHAMLPLGSAILAHQIIDQARGGRYYPQFVVDRPVPTATVMTVYQPEKHYQEDVVYDMEAASFWEVASRLTTGELIHSYKIISDNQRFPISTVTKEKVKNWIENHLPNIEKFIVNLQDLSHSLSRLELSSEEADPFLTKWHFTATQQVHLKTLLLRWKASTSCSTADLYLEKETFSQPSSRHLLQYLDNKLRFISHV